MMLLFELFVLIPVFICTPVVLVVISIKKYG